MTRVYIIRAVSVEALWVNALVEAVFSWTWLPDDDRH